MNHDAALFDFMTSMHKQIKCLDSVLPYEPVKWMSARFRTPSGPLWRLHSVLRTGPASAPLFEALSKPEVLATSINIIQISMYTYYTVHNFYAHVTIFLGVSFKLMWSHMVTLCLNQLPSLQAGDNQNRPNAWHLAWKSLPFPTCCSAGRVLGFQVWLGCELP